MTQRSKSEVGTLQDTREIYLAIGQVAGNINDILPPQQYPNGLVLIEEPTINEFISFTTWHDRQRYAGFFGIELVMRLTPVMDGYALLLAIEGRCPGTFIYQRYLDGSYWQNYGPVEEPYGAVRTTLGAIERNNQYYLGLVDHLLEVHHHLTLGNFTFEPDLLHR